MRDSTLRAGTSAAFLCVAPPADNKYLYDICLAGLALAI